MNLLFSCIGRRGYMADFFRRHLKRGDRIIGTSNTPWTSGLLHCDQGILMPDLASKTYIDSILRAVSRFRIDAIISFFDQDIAVLSRHADDLKRAGITLFIPPRGISHICFDKYQTYLFCRKNGLPAPRTYLRLAAALSALKENKIRFPLIVKKRHGFASQGLAMARNRDELIFFFNAGKDMIIQEGIVGQEYHFDILCDPGGNVVSVVPKRKIMMRAGETDQAVTEKKDHLLDFGVRLGRALGLVGPLDVDAFDCGGKLMVIDLNPRFGGGYPLSHMAGADFPKMLLGMIRGRKTAQRIGEFADQHAMMKEPHWIGGPFREQERNLLDFREGGAP